MTSSTDSSTPVALITGGAGGLGRAVTNRLANAGFAVAVVDLDLSAAEMVATEIRSAVSPAVAYRCDVTDRVAVESLRDQVYAEHGTLHSLINLAGVTRNAPLLKIEDADFDLVFRTHVVSTLNTIRAFAPAMKRQGYGRVVNTSSVAAGGSPAGASYGTAKAAIEGLTRTAALELARHGVTVNCVAPGLVEAGMFLRTPDDYRQSFIDRIPVKRYADPDEIAACVEFFASPSSSYVTGQILTACGGLTLTSLA